jgi:hypothetical protein
MYSREYERIFYHIASKLKLDKFKFFSEACSFINDDREIYNTGDRFCKAVAWANIMSLCPINGHKMLHKPSGYYIPVTIIGAVDSDEINDAKRGLGASIESAAMEAARVMGKTYTFDAKGIVDDLFIRLKNLDPRHIENILHRRLENYKLTDEEGYWVG